ncbi:MAG: cell division protein SepF [Oscillospiraceae bacterium]|nr:cell division protein SepF [Oscillospiraceae bacterium]
MGFITELKKLVHPYAEEDEDVFPSFTTPSREQKQKNGSSSSSDTAATGKVLNIHTTTQLQVVLVQPEHFESASDIADHLRDRRTVVLNLEKANAAAMRRLVDFLSGVVYAQGGKIKPVAKNTYLITPYNVDIMGGDLMDELESNGWY